MINIPQQILKEREQHEIGINHSNHADLGA